MSLEIREATQSDVPDIVKIHMTGWQAAYADVVNSEFLKSYSQQEREGQWHGYLQNDESRTYVAQNSDGIIGISSVGRIKTLPNGMSKIRPSHAGEVYALYLLPGFYRQRIGSKLFIEGVKGLRELKLNSFVLWTLEKNIRSRAFYDAMGGKRIGNKMVEFGPTKAKEVCYGWRDIKEILIK